MISNQILQSTIEGIKNISRVELCVTDIEGKVLALETVAGDLHVSIGWQFHR